LAGLFRFALNEVRASPTCAASCLPQAQKDDWAPQLQFSGVERSDKEK